jgi:pyruvate dehydrogenase phosphatase
VVCRRLRGKSNPRFLILATDGFADSCGGDGQPRVIRNWARELAKSSKRIPADSGGKSWNMALNLLRKALYGEDRFSVSRVLTLDMDVAWIDDTSIVVQSL